MFLHTGSIISLEGIRTVAGMILERREKKKRVNEREERERLYICFATSGMARADESAYPTGQTSSVVTLLRLYIRRSSTSRASPAGASSEPKVPSTKIIQNVSRLN
jgi:hypothetical protein